MVKDDNTKNPNFFQQRRRKTQFSIPMTSGSLPGG
jgi:hypothetical protein